MKINKKRKEDTDESVQKMIETWDVVRCRQCNKRISMLNAKLVKQGTREFFVCKEHR